MFRELLNYFFLLIIIKVEDICRHDRMSSVGIIQVAEFIAYIRSEVGTVRLYNSATPSV